MSSDEVIVLLGGMILSGWFGWRWYARLNAPGLRIKPDAEWLSWAPPAVAIGIFITLLTGASYDVRSAPSYLVLYTALGAAWMFAAVAAFSLLGVSFRDDAVERRNRGAAILVACVLIANAAIYAGANIGDGPGWWCVVVAGFLGAAGWFALWAAVEAFCGASEQITVERSATTAIRLGGYAVASGLIWARGAAGDWTSLGDTISEMRAAWPAIPLAAVAIGIELWLRGQALEKDQRIAALIALVYVAAGVAAVALSPALPQNPAYP